MIRYKDTPKGIASKKYKESMKHTPKHKHQRFIHQMKYVYGVSEKEYSDMLDSQMGACPICDDPLYYGDMKMRPKVDHCHETGRIRGVLCHGCNTGIGLLKDKTEVLEKAIKYLKGGYCGLAK